MSEVNQAIDNLCAHINAECENGCGTKMRRSLQQYFVAPAWSQEAPVKPGWYWYKDPFLAEQVIEVSFEYGVNKDVLAAKFTWGQTDVESLEGRWAGPIVPPEGTR